jgi:N-acetyl-gamma-glutamyl-phosphate reductase
MIKAGIIGGAGYTAGELIRLLLNHPETEIVFINSSSNAGNRITDVHEGLYGETDLRFTDQLPLDEIDVLFFCTAHGDTKKFMESHNIPENLKIIDLSMDYRIKSDDHDFIYGLPELNRRATCTAKHVANPGCFATCIQLGLLPLAKNLMLTDDVMVNAIKECTYRQSFTDRGNCLQCRIEQRSVQISNITLFHAAPHLINITCEFNPMLLHHIAGTAD